MIVVHYINGVGELEMSFIEADCKNLAIQENSELEGKVHYLNIYSFTGPKGLRYVAASRSSEAYYIFKLTYTKTEFKAPNND